MSKKPKKSTSRKPAEPSVRGQRRCGDHVTSNSAAHEHHATGSDANPTKTPVAPLQDPGSSDELVRDLEDSGYPVDGTDHSQE